MLTSYMNGPYVKIGSKENLLEEQCIILQYIVSNPFIFETVFFHFMKTRYLLQLMSTGASLEGFGERYLVFIE